MSGGWRLAAGGWRLASGGWRLASGAGVWCLVPCVVAHACAAWGSPELANKGRELAAHFDTHGTPIMMGGGNLAFTLLGIDFNGRYVG